MNKKIKGTLSGFLSGIFWGFDTSLNGYVLLAVPFILSDSRLISATLLLAFFHDFISALILTGALLIKKELTSFFTVLKTRSSRFVMLAALFAGPLGMRSYLYAVDTIGAGLAATISSLYPALAAILGAFFLKDYLNRKGWLGLVLSILAIAILGYSNFSIQQQILFGLLAAFLCTVGWASESVIIAYGMQNDIMPLQALLIRQWVSSIAYLVFMMFDGDLVYSVYGVITAPIFPLIIIMGLLGTFSYLCYYSAIDSIGPVKATGLNVTYSIWAIIFSLVLLGGSVDLRLIFCGLLIVVGASLMLKD